MRQTILAFCLLGSVAAMPALAAMPFDGEWDVGVIVESGACTTGYMLPIKVRNGAVSYNGEISTSAKGTIGASGAVNVNFVHGKDEVTATGKLTGSGGAGKWTSKTLKCTGRWQANKRA